MALGSGRITAEPGRVPRRNCVKCGEEIQGGSGNNSSTYPQPKEERTAALNPTLSFREGQVVNLVCKAKLNKEIAHELQLTEGTVKEYLSRIFRKLGVSNRTQLAIWALSHHADPVV